VFTTVGAVGQFSCNYQSNLKKQYKSISPFQTMNKEKSSNWRRRITLSGLFTYGTTYWNNFTTSWFLSLHLERFLYYGRNDDSHSSGYYLKIKLRLSFFHSGPTAVSNQKGFFSSVFFCQTPSESCKSLPIFTKPVTILAPST